VLDNAAMIIVSARVDDGLANRASSACSWVPQGRAACLADFRGLAAGGPATSNSGTAPADALLGDGSDALPRSKPRSTAPWLRLG
jgi:hypothetical protein